MKTKKYKTAAHKRGFGITGITGLSGKSGISGENEKTDKTMLRNGKFSLNLR